MSHLRFSLPPLDRRESCISHLDRKMALLSPYQNFPTALALLILAFEVMFTLLSIFITSYIFFVFENLGALEPAFLILYPSFILTSLCFIVTTIYLSKGTLSNLRFLILQSSSLALETVKEFGLLVIYMSWGTGSMSQREIGNVGVVGWGILGGGVVLMPFLVGTVTAWCVWVHNRDFEYDESDDEEMIWERRPLLRPITR